eukprot:TRINITY_DN4525_c1_g2_i6.p2 TRINITY_DN4525_c1_g2~~TRINITY_DN4525_c1_g2_i6.p2  ORF type:complete len:301 (-),score=8.87 TRINITY_DN4525_c1_g2_i6:2988-3890(-)
MWIIGILNTNDCLLLQSPKFPKWNSLFLLSTYSFNFQYYIPIILEGNTLYIKYSSKTPAKRQTVKTQRALQDQEIIQANAQERIETSPADIQKLIEQLRPFKEENQRKDIEEANTHGYESCTQDTKYHIQRQTIKQKPDHHVEEIIYKLAVILIFLVVPWQAVNLIICGITTVMMSFQMLGHISFAKSQHVPKLGLISMTLLRLSDMITHAFASRHMYFCVAPMGWIPIFLHSTQAIWHLMKLREDTLMKIHVANVLDALVYVIGVGFLFLGAENKGFLSIKVGLGFVLYIFQRLRNQVW